MLQTKYIDLVQQIVRKRFPENKAFIFGSSLRDPHFCDVDIAIQGVKNWKEIFEIKEDFMESNFPRTVDVVDFDRAEKSFQDYVLTQEIKKWI